MNLHSFKIDVAVTGGGSLFISDRLTEGGASEYLLEAHVPYDTAALDQFVGKVREKYCSASTARQMALTCYQRGTKLTNNNVIGVGATCSLVKPEGEREGREHHIYIAFVCGCKVVELSWDNSGSVKVDTREAQEKLAASLIKVGLERFANVLDRRSHKEDVQMEDAFAALGGETLGVKVRMPKEEAWDIYRSILINPAMVRPYGKTTFENAIERNERRRTICVYPGSFNPWHAGHEEVYQTAVRFFGEENTFLELSIFNFDKPGIDSLELEDRLKGLDYKRNTLVTGSTKFIDKFNRFSVNEANVVFAVGADTFERIDLEDFKDTPYERVKFLVFPRNGKSIRNFSAVPWMIDNRSYDLKEGAPISSTELRKNKK